MKFINNYILFIIFILLFSNCGGNSQGNDYNNPFIGIWQFQDIQTGCSVIYEFDENYIFSLIKNEKVIQGSYSYSLNQNNTWKLTLVVENDNLGFNCQDIIINTYGDVFIHICIVTDESLIFYIGRDRRIIFERINHAKHFLP